MDELPTSDVYTQDEIDSAKALSAICYVLPIIVLVPLIQKDNSYALFHARQVLIMVVLLLGISVLALVPVVGWCFFGPASFVAWLTFAVIGVMNSINGRAQMLPLIGVYGERWFAGVRKG